MAPVPASRTTTRGGPDAPCTLPDPPPRRRLHLLHGWWIASCPDCGHELGRSRDQAQAEHAGRRRRCPICQPAGEEVA